MLQWNSWLRGRADRVNSHRTVPPARIRSGGLTPPGSPAPRPSLVDARASDLLRVETRLRSVAAEALGVAPGELSCDVSLIDELAVDSLDLLELVLAADGPRIIDRRADAGRGRWTLRELDVDPVYAAAVAVDGPAIRLSAWRWPPRSVD